MQKKWLKRFPLWESENASQSPFLWRHLPLSPKPYEVSSHKYSECKYVSRRRRRENTWTLLKIELVDDPFRWDVKLRRTLQACAAKKVSKQINYWGIIEEGYALFIFRTIFIRPKFDHWPPLSLTNCLTHSCWVDLTDVILAFEEAVLKLLDVVSAELVDNSLVEILKLRGSQRLASCCWRSAQNRGSAQRISDREPLESELSTRILIRGVKLDFSTKRTPIIIQ